MPCRLAARDCRRYYDFVTGAGARDMRTVEAGLLILLAMAAIPAARAEAGPRCDVRLDVSDPDPNGLNVRAEPSAESKIVSVLKPATTDDGWVEVHAVGHSGDWYEIDRAILISNSLPGKGEKTIFAGRGYVHQSKVGATGMFGLATVLDKPDKKNGKPVTWDMQSDAPMDVLDCSGPFYKVRLRKVIGWSKDVCTNELTTCV